MEKGNFYLQVNQKENIQTGWFIKVTKNVDLIDIKKGVGESHTSEKQRVGDVGTLGLLYNFGCER